jgi:mono/diheme cytochrome c family protein
VLKFTAALVVGLSIYGAVPARGEEGPDLRSQQLIQQGRALFGGACSYCHGESAAGGSSGAPGLRGRTDLGAQDIFDTISNGRVRASNIMPAWKESLSESERWALTAYILSLATSPDGSR